MTTAVLPPSCPRCGFDLLATTAPPPLAPSPPRPPRRARLSAASVPRILLGLGATCLLVAAVIFLAVAWTWLGIGGRTLVLVTLTAVTAALGQWLVRRDLVLAAEALTTVSLGLLLLDLVGARDAGWLPVTGAAGFLAITGGALLSASLVLRRLVVPQLAAPLGVVLLAVAVGLELDRVEPAAAAALVGCAALALVQRPVLRWSAYAVGVGAWVVLLLAGGVAALLHPSLSGLWVEGHGWWLLVAALLPLTRRLGVPVAAALLTAVVALPVVDEGATAFALAAAAAVAGWGLVRRRWAGGWVPILAAGVVLLPVPLLVVANALEKLGGESADPFADPLVLPVAVAAIVVAAPWRWRAAVGALGLSAALTATLILPGLSADHRALGVIAVAGLLALGLPRVEVEVPAWVVGAGVLLVTSAPAPHLTLAGALLTASALLHRDRRPVGWAGGLLLAAATWVRLAELGVHAPEPYTLPSALALVALGLLRLRRDPGADTVVALLPGLALATVPSLLWVLEDPVSVRAVALGLACLVLLLTGTAVRWSAPVLVGGVVGGLLVLREVAPYAAQTPQWLLIGAAGTLLVAVGVTWEARLRDLRLATGFLSCLR